MAETALYTPGCFGLMATYAEDEVCGRCPHKVECAVIHHRAVKQLRAFHGLPDKEPSRQVGELPVKVKKVFEELGKTVSEVKQMMWSGLNPYSLQAGFIGVVCHVVLNAEETNRAFLTEILMRRRKYNEATADVYARHSIQILQHCGVIAIEGDKIKRTRG